VVGGAVVVVGGAVVVVAVLTPVVVVLWPESCRAGGLHAQRTKKVRSAGSTQPLRTSRCYARRTRSVTWSRAKNGVDPAYAAAHANESSWCAPVKSVRPVP